MRTAINCLWLNLLPFSVALAQTASSPSVSHGALIVTLGTDTIAVEKFERTTTGMTGTLVRRSPVTTIHQYSVVLAANGTPVRFVDSLFLADGSPKITGTRSYTVTFSADSAKTVIQRDTAIVQRSAVQNGFPALPESYALNELWLSTLAKHAGDSSSVGLVSPAGGPSGRLGVKRISDDSARMWILGSPAIIRTDPAGRVLSFDGHTTTVKYDVHRVDDLDIKALARGFGERDAAGQSFGVYISGRDTVRSASGTASLWIDYGRPHRRGRALFAQGVLGDTLWRTGANAATQIEFSEPVSIGGHALPAGRYSLWTRIAKDNSRYELVVNSQTGQWGTQHDASRDLFAAPLEVRKSGSLVEVFTLASQPTSCGWRLSLAWGELELGLPITVQSRSSGASCR